MEYMYVRSTNKLAAFMGATFTRTSGKQLLAKVRAFCCCRWWLLEPRGLLLLSWYILIKTERTSRAVRNTVQVSQRSHHSDVKQAHRGCVKMCCHRHDAIIGCEINFVCKIFVVWGNHEIFVTTKISRSTVCGQVHVYVHLNCSTSWQHFWMLNYLQYGRSVADHTTTSR